MIGCNRCVLWAGDGLHGWVSMSTLFNAEVYKEDAGGCQHFLTLGRVGQHPGYKANGF